jgi:hypothetical protein
VVIQHRIDESVSREQRVSTPMPGVAAGWRDSTQAMQAFMQTGGTTFFGQYPAGRITSMSLRDGPDGKAVWSISATSRPDYGEGSDWSLGLDAATGQVDSSAIRTVRPGTNYLTAREAVAVAQKAALAWRPDARLSAMKSQVNPDEMGYDTARASTWWCEFISQSANKRFDLTVADGVVRDASQLDVVFGDAVTGDWPDSPQALEKFLAAPEYAAFKAAFPQHSFSFVLEGDARAGSIWVVGALVKSAAVAINVTASK